MSVSLYETAVKRHQRELGAARTKQIEQTKKANDAEARARQYEEQAATTTSASSARSKMSQAKSKRKEAEAASKKAGEALKAVGKAEADLVKAQANLEAAREKERKKADDKQAAAERKRQRDEERDRRAQQRRESERDAELAGLRAETGELRERVLAKERASAPERITVLFVSANPRIADADDPSREQPLLGLENEVREIQQRMRTSELRDSLHIDYRPARRVTDLMEDLNEVKPHIVHFSGHGNDEELIFEDDDAQPQALSHADLAQLLKLSSRRIRLAVFNACNSAGAANRAVDHVEAAIGMNVPINDLAAQKFAGQFYNSLGYGRTLLDAFEQAVLQTRLEMGFASGEPQLHTAPGVDASEVILVQGAPAPEAP
jgi:hypothetical protein